MKDHPLVLFDGVCNLCNAMVDFIIKRKGKKPFLFVALQSETGQKLTRKYNISSEIDSVILIDQNKVFIESEAALEIARRLAFPWKLAIGFKIFPVKWLNKIYRWIAKNRFRWFGKKTSCRMPSPEEKILFPEATDLDL